MVAFDLDVNKDGTPDRVYAMRVNGMGQIVDQRVLDATVGIASSKERDERFSLVIELIFIYS